MNLSRDTQKSLGMLLKSLKMSRRAIEKNQVDDGTTAVEVQEFADLEAELMAKVEFWLDTAKIAPVIPVATPVPIIPVVDAGTTLTV